MFYYFLSLFCLFLSVCASVCGPCRICVRLCVRVFTVCVCLVDVCVCAVFRSNFCISSAMDDDDFEDPICFATSHSSFGTEALRTDARNDFGVPNSLKRCTRCTKTGISSKSLQAPAGTDARDDFKVSEGCTKPLVSSISLQAPVGTDARDDFEVSKRWTKSSSCVEQNCGSSSLSQPQRKRRSRTKSNDQQEEVMSCAEVPSSTQEIVWEELEYPRKAVPSLRTGPSGKISPESLHEVFMTNPNISRKLTCDEFVEFKLGTFAEYIEPLINKSLPPLDLNDLRDQRRAGDLYPQFVQNYIPLIDQRLKAFLNLSFKTPDDAISCLNIVIRSFICGFSVHRMKSYQILNGATRIPVQCHTRHDKKVKSESDDGSVVRQNCKWTAIVQVEGKTATFVRIDSFSLHNFNCFCRCSRMTPNEVSFQRRIPSVHLNGILNRFRQFWRAKKALYMRKYRMNRAIEALVDAKFREGLKNQKICDCISNVRDYSVQPDEELELILRYLSKLHDTEELETFVTFAESDALTRVEASSINMMWKEGRSLLSTHSDVIFCDSMWNVSINGYYVLTIVVVDENYDIRLAALSLVSKERKDSWRSFFEWVKGVVPSFDPKCIVTDGALYIDTGFKEAIGSKALNIVCWWHQRENVLKKIGIKRELGRIFLRMTYAQDKKTIKTLIRRAKAIAEGDVEILASKSFEKMVQNCSKNALIALKVFTAGTVTNSYSESINSILRSAGLKTGFTMLTVLRYLQNFSVHHNCRTKHRFRPNAELLSIIGNDIIDNVTAGALCRFKQKAFNPAKMCTVTKQDGTQVIVKEKVVVGVRIRLFNLKGRRRISKNINWRVKWSGGIPVCSCNGCVYSGIPCAHIVRCALHYHLKIPLQCFNPRFYYQSRIRSGDLPAVEQPDFDLSEVGNDDDNNLDEEMLTVTDDEGKCSEMQTEEYGDCRLELVGSDEITFYSKIYNLSVSLTELYASPESMDKAKAIEQWLSLTSDGLALGCISSCAGDVPSDPVECRILNDIHLNNSAGNLELKQIIDDLHISDAGMNSTYVSEEMCEFRGRLKAVMIKIILVRRVCPRMVSNIIFQLEKKVNSLKTSVEKSGSATSTAGLKPVYGSLHPDSYFSVADLVSKNCKQSLIEACNNSGVCLSLLLHASNNSGASKRATKKDKKKKNQSSVSLSNIGPRLRKMSSRYSFLSTHI